MKRALQVILVFALAGLAFSYGFFMYLAITVVAVAGLRAGARTERRTTLAAV